MLLISLLVWYRALGSISVDTVTSPKAEIYYWVTILFSQTLGTALGDWTADTEGLGFGGGVMVFASLLVIVAAVYYTTTISRTLLFWTAFVLTRPLGAVLGDLLDKPRSEGGLDLSRVSASAVLLLFVIACIVIFPQRAARQRH
jgi:uncharacterized membrane-anchored protein